MSDPHGHSDHSQQQATLPFHDADWQDFHNQDKGAGGAIIVLMTAIFSIGLVLYTAIAWWVF